MMDLFLGIGLSNACFALALALVAMAVGAKARRPHLAHLLWLLVFVKLITPPLVTIPVDAFSQPTEPAGTGARAFVAGTPAATAETVPGPSLLSRIAPVWHRTKPCLAALWLLGSAAVLVWSMARVYRFGRLLAEKSDVAPAELHRGAEEIARRLGLATTPTICTTSAHLSPLVWWAGGPVRIVIPKALLDQMDAQDWQWILAHELAHVRRRDHLVRWVEWLACVCFWWNPVVWWAQRNLRAMEEICCDDLVLSRLHPQPRSYADCLLSAVEFLARPAVRAPALASEIHSGGNLERRFRMIVASKSNRSRSRWLHRCVLACTLAVLPLGLASAQDYDAVAKRLKESVQKGEITPAQAQAMMAALKKEPGKGQSRADLSATWEKLQAQVQAGELTKEQARDKMMALRAEAVKKDGKDKKDVVKKDQDLDKTTAYLMRLKEDLGAAVEAGKISKEDAAKKYEAAKRGIQEKEAGKDQSQADLGVIWEKLQAQVRAGEITKEQAIEKMTAIKSEAAQKDSKDKKVIKKDQDVEKVTAYLTKVKKDLADAVEAGKISKEDAVEKYEATARDLKAKTAAKKDLKDPPVVKKDLKDKPIVKKDRDLDKATNGPTKVKKDRGTAAEAGKISKKDPIKKLEPGTTGKKDAAESDYDALSKELKAAVQAGKLTKEEAKAKREAIKKQAAQDKEDN
jgi:beta-lactamase regulating signal transducer with metallopeptidase domain